MNSTSSNNQRPAPGQGFGVTASHWLGRGMMVGVLFGAACNTASYFVRSEGFWGGLLGRSQAFEAIGFPLEMWRMTDLQVNPAALVINVGLVAVFAAGCGLVAMWLREPLIRLVVAIEEEVQSRDGQRPAKRLQFTLRGMLLLTVACGGLAAMVRSAGPESLAAIYLLGPAAMIILAFLPRGYDWRQRAVLLAPMSIALIAAAIVIGWRAGVDFEKVLLGVAVSWTTQSSAAALLLTSIILFLYRRTLFPHHA